MKKILLFNLLLLTILTATIPNKMEIRISKNQTPNSQDSYQFACKGAKEPIKFTVEGLPAGVYQDQDKIVVGQNTQAGNYFIRIKATDANGEIAEKIVNLEIVVTSAHNNSVSQSFNSSISYSSSSSNKNISFNGIQSTSENNRNRALNMSIDSQNNRNKANIDIRGSGIIPITSGTLRGNKFIFGATTQKVNQITNTKLTLSDVLNLKYDGNKYITPSLPFRGISDFTRTTPVLIQTIQTQPSNRNKNKLTANDVALRAASDRYQNAKKGLQNLLKIIDQAKANKNQAETEIFKYTNIYNKAVNQQKIAQQALLNIQTKVTQITSAINSISTQICNLQNQTGQTGGQKTVLMQQKTGLQSQIDSLNKNTAQTQIDSINTQLEDFKNQLFANQFKCNDIAEQISNNKVISIQFQQKLGNIDKSIDSLKISYNQKQTIVNDLQNKLNAAIADRDNSKKQLDQAVLIRKPIPDQITQINNKLLELTNVSSECKLTSDSIQKQINSLDSQLDFLNKQLININSKAQSLQSQMNNLTNNITQMDTSGADVVNKTNNLNNQLILLKQQSNNANIQKTKLYQAEKDAYENVQSAKKNLDTVINKFKCESNIVQTTTQNLQKARAQEVLAKQALEELLPYYTSSLSYTLGSNSKILTQPGKPTDTKPSRSYLGTINQEGVAAFGSLIISNWTNYLSQVYGQGIFPAYRGSVTALYPFTFSSIVKGNNMQSNIRKTNTQSSTTDSCPENSSNLPSTSLTGIITSVTNDSFDLKLNDGTIATVSIFPSTTLNSNKLSYHIKCGDIAIAKGIRQNKNIFNGQAITCLCY